MSTKRRISWAPHTHAHAVSACVCDRVRVCAPRCFIFYCFVWFERELPARARLRVGARAAPCSCLSRSRLRVAAKAGLPARAGFARFFVPFMLNLGRRVRGGACLWRQRVAALFPLCARRRRAGAHQRGLHPGPEAPCTLALFCFRFYAWFKRLRA